MRVVIDTNIIISAIINKDGKEADIILNKSIDLIKYTCSFLNQEVLAHKEKIKHCGNLNEFKFWKQFNLLTKRIKFINEAYIKEDIWRTALNITKAVDEQDIPFVALSLSLNTFLWSGDKQLVKKLKEIDFNTIITTNELIEKLNELK